jgi:siroheme decarboxylase
MELTAIEKKLLDAFQRDFPLVERPYAVLAERLGIGESEVIGLLDDLRARGYINRVGAVLQPNRAGASTLAAMSVPAHRLEAVAALVNAWEGVNHNYRRENRYNLWFVIGAEDEVALESSIAAIESQTGIAVLRLPLEESYHIDLGFKLQWN